MRRVVVTGLGMVTPLGVGVDHNWSQIIAGETGIRRITDFEVDDLACQIAGQVPGADQPGGLDMDAFIMPREQRKQDRFIQLGIVAAQLAVEDSRLMEAICAKLEEGLDKLSGLAAPRTPPPSAGSARRATRSARAAAPAPRASCAGRTCR